MAKTAPSLRNNFATKGQANSLSSGIFFVAVFFSIINIPEITGKPKPCNSLKLVLAQGFFIPGTDPGNELVFNLYLMKCKHWGNMKFIECHSIEVTKLFLVFVNSKYCLGKVKKSFVLG